MQIERFEAAHSDGVGIIGEQMSQPKVISQTSKERIVRPCSHGIGDGHVPYATGRSRASGGKTQAGLVRADHSPRQRPTHTQELCHHAGNRAGSFQQLREGHRMRR